jgi:hypothetical protein
VTQVVSFKGKSFYKCKLNILASFNLLKGYIIVFYILNLIVYNVKGLFNLYV